MRRVGSGFHCNDSKLNDANTVEIFSSKFDFFFFTAFLEGWLSGPLICFPEVYE